jgi:DHA1 family tetracycline resistance protein-like MFS transporter
MFAVGLAAALVQGVLLGRLLKRFAAKKLAIIGLVSSTLGYLAWGLAPAGWVMYLIIALNLLGFTVTAAMQSIVSNAADASSQGQTMGSVASLTSLMAVVGPVLGAPLMGAVSHLQPGDWRIGAPFYFCAAVQLLSLLVATRHFRRERHLASLSAAQSPAA